MRGRNPTPTPTPTPNPNHRRIGIRRTEIRRNERTPFTYRSTNKYASMSFTAGGSWPATAATACNEGHARMLV